MSKVPLGKYKQFFWGTAVLAAISAVIISVNSSGSSTSAVDMPTNINIRPSLTLDVSSNLVELILDPANSSTAFASDGLTITIGTNNPTGYQLYLNGNDASGSSTTSLINLNDSTVTIPTLTSSKDADGNDYTEANFPANYWGYKIGDGNYLPFTNDLLISSSEGPSNINTIDLNLAAKADYLQPTGTYGLSFTLTVIPNVSTYTMQEIGADAELAKTMCTDNPTVIMDGRDGEIYTIRRLPDGKCWMLDNLNLDLTNKNIVDGMSSENTNADDTTLNYMKNGGREYGEQYPTAGLTYENWLDGQSASQPLANRNGLCQSDQYMCLYPYQYKEGEYTGEYSYNTIINLGGKPSDNATGEGIASTVVNIGYGNYKVGTYYNYCAATAGSYCYGNGTDWGTPSGDAMSDICPAGWKMPTSGANGEWEILTNKVRALYPSEYQDASSQNSIQTILSLPLSGYRGANSAIRQGTAGSFWSPTYGGSASYMLHPYISINSVNPATPDYRTMGYPVRCILSQN